uniref:Uncharacterized protein n=1 Tax=Timema tahoe TaxID=61484 RepID=A0A7R9IKY7_9NEOP|nr:unnamed protein product [Timema tahoe]
MVKRLAITSIINMEFPLDDVNTKDIPPSSDDDRDSLQNEILSYSESVTRPPRRHGRICVPMSFSGIRKQMGKKRFRRYENVDWCSHRMVYPRQDWWELILDQQALYKLPKSLQHADTVAGGGQTGRASERLKYKIEHIGCNERWPDWSERLSMQA